MGNVAKSPETFQVTAYCCHCGYERVPGDLHQIERPQVCPPCYGLHWDRPFKFQR